MTLFRSLFLFLAAFLFAAPFVSPAQAPQPQPQQQSGLQPLLPGSTILKLDEVEQLKLDAVAKDYQINSLKLKVLQDAVENAQTQAAEIQKNQQDLVQSVGQQADAIKKKNKYGDDVYFDVSRLAFVQKAKPVASPAVNPAVAPPAKK